MKKMKGQTRTFLAASVAAILAVGGASESQASATCGLNGRQVRSEIALIEASVEARVVAVGRVDVVSKSRGVGVLGFVVMPSSNDQFQIGDYAAVIDWSRQPNKQILEVRKLTARYVPGASEVFLRAEVKSKDTSRAKLRVGNAEVDYSLHILDLDHGQVASGATLAVRGVQPSPGGVILGSCISAPNGSMGTGRPDGSMGTGKPNGSMGTGRPDGSMGTGKLNGSMGTGRPDGSMGTGRPDGSMGTGRES
jgi:hypothetical protein